MKLVTAAQMQAIEEASSDRGISFDQLMENAGRMVADTVSTALDGYRKIFGKRLLVLVGPGNNGSDGLVAARHLSKDGAGVTAILCAHRKSPDTKRDLAEAAGVAIINGVPKKVLAILKEKIESSDMVIDAVLGTGTSRPISEPLRSLIRTVREADVPVSALDLPSGLNSDTGEFDVAGLPANLTMMLGYPKLGTVISDSPSSIGKPTVLDIGIPPDLDTDITAELMTTDNSAQLQPYRPHHAHKGTFGTVLVVGGSKEFIGAAALSADAATRSGVGLTYVAVPEPAYRQIAGKIPDAIYRSLPVSTSGIIDPLTAVPTVVELSKHVASIVIGPGLGHNPSTTEFLWRLLPRLNKKTPIVLDADALNILAESDRWSERVGNPAVLTPHPGEMAKLLGTSIAEVQRDRIGTVLDAAKRFNKVVILKGAATIIATPKGELRVSDWVNHGLSKGGSGDVLAGLIGGLLAQEPTQVYDMASLGVFTHGYAGDAARKDIGETGMRATDVIERLGHFYRDIIQRNQK